MAINLLLLGFFLQQQQASLNVCLVVGHTYMMVVISGGGKKKQATNQGMKEYASVQGIDSPGSRSPTPVKHSRLVFILIKLWRSCS